MSRNNCTRGETSARRNFCPQSSARGKHYAARRFSSKMYIEAERQREGSFDQHPKGRERETSEREVRWVNVGADRAR